jgi:hypothetical protein
MQEVPQSAQGLRTLPRLTEIYLRGFARIQTLAADVANNIYQGHPDDAEYIPGPGEAGPAHPVAQRGRRRRR